MIENRKAKIHHHPDGRHVAAFEADLRHGDFVYPWRHAHDLSRGEFDPEPVLAELDARLAHRATIIDGIFALVGKGGIIEANLQVHGPAMYRLFVIWEEQHDGVTVQKSLSRDFDHPKDCPAPDEILAEVQARAAASAATLARATAAAARFGTVSKDGAGVQ